MLAARIAAKSPTTTTPAAIGIVPVAAATKRASWLERQQRDLLPVPYFHVVFTLPHELSALVLGNRKILYDLLVRGHTGDALDHRRRRQASGSAAGRALGAAHLGPAVGASSPYPCGGPRRRVVTGRHQVGGEPRGLLGIGECAGPAVPRQVPG